ncbi:MAG: hypothetical protein JNM17_24565 [Archangium sp.]|nr:hypothetical protein [Archangium sp.]
MRRVLFIVTLGAVASRLYVLGQEKGFELVARATVLITATALGAWLLHLVLHEVAHWVAAVSQDFVIRGVMLGPLAFDFVTKKPRTVVSLRASLSGGVNSLPRGADGLRTRLRVVAGAGPAMTLLVTLLSWRAWATSGESIASMLGVFVAMGALTFVTAMLPGALLPTRPESGTDLEQLIQPRAVLAHWVNAAAVQRLFEGARVSQVLDREAWRWVLPPLDGAVEPIELGWCISCLDGGAVNEARVRLRTMAERLDESSPEWLRTDAFNQLGCLSAFDGDVALAKTCLERVRETQSIEWYCELLVACVARAEGGDAAAPLARWYAGVEVHPTKIIALAGNEWILARLGTT